MEDKPAPTHAENIDFISPNPADKEAQHVDEPSEDFEWDWNVILNILALASCYFSATWGLLVPTSSIPFIVQRFPQQVSMEVWISAAVTIPNCVLQAFVGELSDILGRRSFLLAGMLLGLIGALVSGRANSLEMVIGGQVLTGCGTTLGYLAIPLVAELVPKDRRPIVQGLVVIPASFATLTGPIIQGACIKHNVGGLNEGWRCGFYILAGLDVVTAILLILFYHPAKRPNSETESTLHRTLKIDWIGVFLVAAGIVLFLVGLQYGGNQKPWTSALVLSTLIVGGLILILFGLYNWLIRKDGLLDHNLFKHRNFAIVLALNFVTGIIFFGSQAFLPQEIIILYTSDAVMTAVYNIPYNGLAIIGSVVSGIIMSKTKEGKTLIIASYGILLVGTGLMAVEKPHINFAGWFFPTALLGSAVGSLIVVPIVVIGLCTPDHLIAHAVSMGNSVRGLGGAVGVVILQQIVQTKAKHILPGKLFKALLGAGLPPQNIPQFLELAAEGATSALAKIPGVTPAVLEAYATAEAQGTAEAFRYLWYSLIPFVVVSLGLALFLKSTKEQMTRVVVASVQHRSH